MSGEGGSLTDETQYFTDSRDVLDWLANTKDMQKRFVANRVRKILTFSSLGSWHYIPTNINPELGQYPSRSLRILDGY